MSNKFAALENFYYYDCGGGSGGGMDICRTWESTGENVETPATDSLSYYELKQHKTV
jgi:hypothetical protein